MITVHVVLKFSVFTKAVKEILDEALKDLPLGSRVFISLENCPSPFSIEEKEQQVRTCYSPSENEIILFENPVETLVAAKVRNTRDSYDESLEICQDIVANRPYLTDSFSPQTLDWVHHWLGGNETLLNFFHST